MKPPAWPWLALATGIPLSLWLLVPGPRELAAVALHARTVDGGENEPFDMVKPVGLARLRALVALAPDRLDWRRTLARTLEDAGKPGASMTQWRAIAANPHATADDLREAARELIGHAAQPEGVALLESLADAGRLDAGQLQDAAVQAGSAGLWPQAAHLLEALAAVAPKDPWPLEVLARVEERQGHVDAAVTAWRRRFALPGSQPSQHLAAVALLERQGKAAEAIALLETFESTADVSEWRERASLAWELGRAREEVDARRALYRLAPGDQENRLALADRLGAEGDHDGARHLYDEALAMAGDDADTLAALAARWVDGGRDEAAAPLLAKLAALDDPPDEALLVLARAERVHDPAAAAGWLDRLHAGGGGDAGTWLLRGDLAHRLGDAATAAAAWRHVLDLVPLNATDATVLAERARAAASLAGVPATGKAYHQPLLGAAHSWAAFYGADAPPDRLSVPDVLVLEPDHAWQPSRFRRPGQKVLAYLSLGEVNRSRPYFAALAARPGTLERPNPRWPGAVTVDPRSLAWWGLVLEKLVPAILARGYDGLFLDTLDAAGSLDVPAQAATAGAMADLVRAIRERYPRVVMVSNGGLGLLAHTAPALDAVAVESVFTDYQFQPPAYRLRDDTAARARVAQVRARVQPYRLPVFVLEYLPPGGGPGQQAVEHAARAAGWIPFISQIGLDALP